MSNVLDDFYLPLLEQEKHYLSKEYKYGIAFNFSFNNSYATD